MRSCRQLTVLSVAICVLVGHGAMAGGAKEAVPLTKRGETLMAKYDEILTALQKEVVAELPKVDEKKQAEFMKMHALVEAVPPQPNPNNSKISPPRYAPAHKLYAEAQSNAVVAATPVLAALDEFLSSDKLDAALAKCALMTHATPRGLAIFAQQGKEEEALIEELLGDDALIQQVMALGGCYEGKYGQAMQIYKAIQKASDRAKEGFWQSFAIASSMEHPDGSIEREGMTPAEVNVALYKYYEETYLKGELDEAFGTYSDFNWRFVMYSSWIDDMNWMREMLRNYRPDHIRTEEYNWRYCRITKTDVPYTSSIGDTREELASKVGATRFQGFLITGGICGPRCFVGKLATVSFGIPTRGARQSGHAAMSRWTPDGWTTVFGAHWTWNSHRDICGLDFSLEERARNATNEYMKVSRSEWIGAALGEDRVQTRQYGIGGGFWSALGFYKKLAIVEEARIAELAATGAELAESNEPAESPNSDWVAGQGVSPAEPEVPTIRLDEKDKTIAFGDDGVITIPPGAAHSVTNTPKILFMRTIEDDGVQVHYSLGGGRPELLKYEVEVPKAGKYELTAKVCTVTIDRELTVRLNRRTMIEIPLPYTKGYWELTKPAAVELNEGRNSFQFTMSAPNKGLSIKEFKLTPVK